MSPTLKLIIASAALSGSAAFAQATPAASAATQSTQAAPIERVTPAAPASTAADAAASSTAASTATASRPHHLPSTRILNPATGVRILTDAKITTVDTANGHLQLRLDHGKANVLVDHPEDGALLLLDLPGGQIDFVRDGFYTVNADTNTLVVLQGEAQVFEPNAPADAKGKNIKEHQGVVLDGNPKPKTYTEAEAHVDLLPWAAPGQSNQQQQQTTTQAYTDNGCDGCSGGGDGYYDAPYAVGWGFGGYPYYGGWGWDYPYYGWGWGYPAWGFGGVYGGGWNGWYHGHYYGGGYHGGYPGGHGGGPRGGGMGGNVRSGFATGGGFHGGGFGGGGFHGGGFGGGGGFHGGGGGGGHR
ncbi:MAG: hypothetical protein PW735_02550 [Acidobacteriaceae bacterium]|nr:hypothetical protein [Acidobacteriaceae bacterium]